MEPNYLRKRCEPRNTPPRALPKLEIDQYGTLILTIPHEEGHTSKATLRLGEYALLFQPGPEGYVEVTSKIDGVFQTLRFYMSDGAVRLFS